MDPEDEIEGFRVVVESLKNLGVKYIFGVVGIPVVEVNIPPPPPYLIFKLYT